MPGAPRWLAVAKTGERKHGIGPQPDGTEQFRTIMRRRGHDATPGDPQATPPLQSAGRVLAAAQTDRQGRVPSDDQGKAALPTQQCDLPGKDQVHAPSRAQHNPA